MTGARRWANVALAAVLLHATYVSGNDQNVHAYVSVSDKIYLAEFAPLVVRADVPPLVRPYRGKRRVIYHCVGCVFPSQYTEDWQHRIDDTTFSVDIRKGKAEFPPFIQTKNPAGRYTVDVYPEPQKHERTQHVTFTLFSR